MENSIPQIDDIILSFLKGEISESEKKTLEEWINTRDSNKEYFKNIYQIWNTAHPDDEKELEKVLQKIKYKLQPKEVYYNLNTETKKIYLSILKWTAVILLSCITGALAFKYFGTKKDIAVEPKFLNEINVPLGSTSNVLLPDGTEVTLNAGSKLTYNMDYGKKRREVNLAGEGYFKVYKNKDVPFIVKTVKANIRALGTEFNVKAYPEEKMIETILVKGSVMVSEIFLPDEKNRKEKDAVILKPGQKLRIFKELGKKQEETAATKVSRNSPEVTITENHQPVVVEKTELEIETSWKDKRWIIKGANLEDLATLLARKYNVIINLNDTELKKYKFSGTIENETIEEVFNIMKYTIPISYKINKGNVMWTLNRNLEKDYKESYQN